MQTQVPIKDYELKNILVGDQNARQQQTPTKGNFFYVIEATHSRFSIEINDGPAFRGSLVRGHIFPADFEIEKIRVTNTDGTGLALTVVVQVGKGEPINHLFNVAADEVTPTLRSDTPSIITETVKTAPGDVAVDTWVELLAADEYRSEVWLITDAAVGGAFWNTSDPGSASENFSRDIKATAETGGLLKIKTTSAIWVRIKTAHSVRALTFKFL